MVLGSSWYSHRWLGHSALNPPVALGECANDIGHDVRSLVL